MEQYDTYVFPQFRHKLLACNPIDRYRKLVQHASRTLAFKSRLLLLVVFEVDVMEILQWFTLYSMIDKP
jgi:hypothetical protein